MPVDGGTAIVNVIANGAGLSSQIAAATKTGVGKATGIISAGFGVALAGAGIAAIKLASDFEGSMNKIQALVGVSANEVTRLSQSVLDLSTQVAVAPKELADALFFIESAGQRGSVALNTLKISAKAAAAGLGSTATVADAVTSAMNAYAKSGLDAATATDIMIAAVKAGKLPPEDLAAALGQVLPVASAVGVSFDQVAAAIAASTREGVTAARAATGVRFLLSSFAAPSAAAVTALHGISISAQDLQNSLASKGLLATLQDLAKQFDLSSAAGKKAFATVVGGARGLSIASILVGENAKAVGKIFGDVTNSTGSLNTAFEAASHTVGFQLHQAFADLQVTLIRLGDVALPVIASVLKTVSDALVKAAPLFKLAADHAGLLLTAFLLFKGATFLPVLLGGIATKLAAFAVAADSTSILSVAAAFESAGVAVTTAGTALSVAAIPAGVFAGALVGLTAALTAWDPLGLVRDQTAFNDALGVGADRAQRFGDQIGAGRLLIIGADDAIKAAAASTAQFDLNTVELDRHTFNLSHSLEQVGTHANRAGKQVKDFAGLGAKDLQAFKSAVVSSVQVTVGEFAKLSDAFKTTPAELAKAAALSVRIARREHADLAAIFGSKDLTDKQKQALANLSADQRDAWARGGAATRAQVAKDAAALQRLNAQNFHAITTAATKETTSGGQQAGKGLTDGVVSGINSGSGAAVSRAHQLGLDVIASLKSAMGVKSPSTEGIKIGRAFSDGFNIGMQQGFANIESALKSLVPLIQQSLGTGASDQARAFLRDLTQLDQQFAQLQRKVTAFRDSIRQGFSGFADLFGTIASALSDFQTKQAQFLTDQAAFQADQTGTLVAPVAPAAPDIHAIVAAQVAAAQAFAEALVKLQKKGLSTANLSALAAQGPGAIDTANALLADPELIKSLNQAQQQIADITQTTADKLTTAAFGDKVTALSENFAKLLAKLQAFIAGITPGEMTDKNKAFIQALEALTKAILRNVDNLSGPGGGGGGGNGGGNGDNGGGPPTRPQGAGLAPGTTVIINLNPGVLVHQGDLPRYLRDTLLELQRRNASLGLGA